MKANLEKEKMNNEEEFYLKLIRDLKSTKEIPSEIDLEKYKPEYTLEEIIEMMNSVEKRVSECLKREYKPIEGFLDFYTKKGKSFNDPKYERLFNISNKNKMNEKQQCASKCLDYSFREKLSGFVSKKGGLQWDNSKIDEFMNLIRKQ